MSDKKSKWTVETAVSALTRNGHVVKGKEITLNGAGIGMLGCADFLRKHGGFSVFYK